MYGKSTSCGYGEFMWDAARSADGSVSFDAPAPTYDLDAFMPLEVCVPYVSRWAACQAH